MNEVKRYGYLGIAEEEDGEVVKWEDYAALKTQRDAMAAENAALKGVFGPGDAVLNFLTIALRHTTYDEIDLNDVSLAFQMSLPETPATDTYLNSVRAEGIHFAANRILAAWKSCLIKATPAEASDVSGAVLSALEFLPKANPEEFKRDYADQVRADIAELLRANKDGE